MSTQIQLYQEVVNHFGTQEKTAEALGIKQASVSAWICGKALMSRDIADLVQDLTSSKFKSIDLRPRKNIAA